MSAKTGRQNDQQKRKKKCEISADTTPIINCIYYTIFRVFCQTKKKGNFSVRILRLEKLYGMCYNRTKLPETLAKPGKSEPERNQCP